MKSLINQVKSHIAQLSNASLSSADVVDRVFKEFELHVPGINKEKLKVNSVKNSQIVHVPRPGYRPFSEGSQVAEYILPFTGTGVPEKLEEIMKHLFKGNGYTVSHNKLVFQETAPKIEGNDQVIASINERVLKRIEAIESVLEKHKKSTNNFNEKIRLDIDLAIKTEREVKLRLEGVH